MVIWITGISGAGKTTLCNALYDHLKPNLPHVIKIDGDDVRQAFGADLSFAERDRRIQIARIQRIVKVLSDQDLIVLVGALYGDSELLAWNRANLRDYFEVYLKASLDLVKRRDAKGLYAKAAAGELSDVVGVDIPWHEPRHADLVIEADDCDSAEALVRRVLCANPRLAAISHEA